MNSRIQGLVRESYKKDQLDPEIVDLIANRLSRHELKQYIRLLKQQEHKKQVIITIPKTMSAEERDAMQKLFTGKKVLYTVDPSMISGIKVVDDDMEYEVSLNQIFQDLINHMNRND